MQRIVLVLVICLFVLSGPTRAAPPWLQLPPTPTLPKASKSGLADVNGIKIWYASFGRGAPVILLHGGLANSNYWGRLVPELAAHHQVVVMDSRGHGRSTRGSEPIGYDVMASDVLAVMDFLKLDKAAIVGWSDGAIIGIDIAIKHPERLSRLFAFAANSDPSGVADISQSAVFNTYLARTKTEYERLSPTPKEYDAFLAQVMKMWETQPHFSAEQFSRIATPVWIVDADHDEAIKRVDTMFMADHIPNSGLLILPQASHFAFLQDAPLFNASVLRFLERQPGN
jgi:pimeloyl-ACP methyl ester carboxylesterase